MHPNHCHIQAHNFPGFISFAAFGGGGIIEKKPSDDVRKAATTSYSGDIVNHYTYQGRKLGKKVYNSQHTLTVDEEYYDELMLNFGKPSRISHADGYVALYENGNTTFYYYLKDHLGNVLSVILPDANNQPVVSQANDYFPFGMSFESTLPNPGIRANYNKLKYNGKEEQEMPGKWLDYGARFYDAQIGRFHSVDPHAETYFDISPYVYTANNPVLYIDPDGKDYGVRYNSETGTIVIYARYYVNNNDHQAMDMLNAALDQWNDQLTSIKIDGQIYSVSFDLQVVTTDFANYEAEKDYAGNTFHLLDGGQFETTYERTGGQKDPSTIGGFVLTNSGGHKKGGFLRNDMDASVERTAHEVGHTLFLLDEIEPGSVMSTQVSTKQMVGVQQFDAKNVARQAKQVIVNDMKGKPALVGRSVKKENK